MKKYGCILCLIFASKAYQEPLLVSFISGQYDSHHSSIASQLILFMGAKWYM